MQPLPLQNGDRLSRDEFERRYLAAGEIDRAELINSVVYVAPDGSFVLHSEPRANLVGWLGNYRAATPGTRLGVNPTIRLDLENEPQPDAVLLIDPQVGGQSRFDADEYIAGAPELIAEVATNEALLPTKKQVYLQHGVQEYIVWRVQQRSLRWLWLNVELGEYVPLHTDENGIIRSQVFPGLWLSVSALMQGDMTNVLAVLQQGVESLFLH